MRDKYDGSRQYFSWRYRSEIYLLELTEFTPDFSVYLLLLPVLVSPREEVDVQLSKHILIGSWIC